VVNHFFSCHGAPSRCQCQCSPKCIINCSLFDSSLYITFSLYNLFCSLYKYSLNKLAFQPLCMLANRAAHSVCYKISPFWFSNSSYSFTAAAAPLLTFSPSSCSASSVTVQHFFICTKSVQPLLAHCTVHIPCPALLLLSLSFPDIFLPFLTSINRYPSTPSQIH
jgi:hypothetical protein